MKTIFENDLIKVSETGKVSDFIATIENKTDQEIQFILDNIAMKISNFSIKPNDWCGILADDEGYQCFEEIKANRFVALAL